MGADYDYPAGGQDVLCNACRYKFLKDDPRGQEIVESMKALDVDVEARAMVLSNNFCFGPFAGYSLT